MANNPADKYAKKTFGQLESQMSRMYREAYKDISQKMNDFTRRHKAKDKQMQRDLKKGKITQEQYAQWMRGQVFIGQQWQDAKASINACIKNVMTSTASLTHQKSIDVFVDNANYTAFQIERDHGFTGGVNFEMYDRKTISRLTLEDPELLPRKRDINGNKLDAWNTKTISNCVSQAILQGESIDELSKRIARDTCMQAGRSSLLYARTAMTGAQNAGRVERMKEAEEMGVKVQKQWMSTLDSRTRDSHRDMDGEIVNTDEEFSNGLEYPGDPGGDDREVYNCRCTLIYHYPEYSDYSKMERTAYYEEGDPEYDPDHRNYETVKGMNYEQWTNYKQDQIRQRYGGEPRPTPEPEKPTFRQPTREEYDGGDAILQRDRDENKRSKDELDKIAEENDRLRNEANDLRKERNRLTSMESTLGGVFDDYSQFYNMGESKYYWAYHKKQEEVSELYAKLDGIERPVRLDFKTEEEYYKASEEYYNKRQEIRSQLEKTERELYKMPTRYSVIEEQREAASLGHEGIQAKRDEINQRLEEIKKQQDKITKRYNEVSQKAFTWNSAKLVDAAETRGVEYSIPTKLETPHTVQEIIDRVGGGDMTQGSCASLGFCYVGQSEGYDVLDFRDGASRQLFAGYCDNVLKGISKETGKPLLTEATNTGTGGSVKLIKQCVPGKEYYFSCGRHVAIVRSDDNGRLEYMELQSRFQNGWKLLGYKDDRRSMDYTFSHRFGCGRSVNGTAYMMDVEDMKGSKLFHRTLGYINTAEDQQKKGVTGHER